MKEHAIQVPEEIDAEAAARLAGALEAAAAAPAAVLVLEGRSGCFSRGMAPAWAAGEASPVEDPGATARAGLERFVRGIEVLAGFPAPTLAVVDGEALGGGLGLAACCDVVLASERASFGLPEGLFGLAPAIVRPVLLGRLRPQSVRLLAFTAWSRSVGEALSLGLVDQVVATGELAAARQRLVHALSRVERGAVAALRRLEAADGGVDAALARGLEETAAALGRPGVRARLRAFLSGGAPWEV